MTPTTALNPAAASRGVFDADMNLDCEICIWESGPTAVAGKKSE